MSSGFGPIISQIWGQSCSLVRMRSSNPKIRAPSKSLVAFNFSGALGLWVRRLLWSEGFLGPTNPFLRQPSWETSLRINSVDAPSEAACWSVQELFKKGQKVSDFIQNSVWYAPV